MDALELDYDLPRELVAQAPPARRDGARLLCVDPGKRAVSHRAVVELPTLVQKALWVVNDTRVIPARLVGRKRSGGKVELLLVEPCQGATGDGRWLCMARASKPLRPGLEIRIAADFMAVVVGHGPGSLWEVALRAPDVPMAIERYGRTPLPPYIERAPEPEDRERYQTVFARHPGAVAAPTAGLHLSHELLGRLLDAGHRIARVTLHVGPGTFSPLRSRNLSEHRMHAERYHVPSKTVSAIVSARAEGRPVLAVGTTVVRTLESAARADSELAAGAGETSLFIYPPYRFKVVDLLLTNFHLPRSTLLALVMAFGGPALIRAAYREAVASRYRFFSYGDAMLIGSQG